MSNVSFSMDEELAGPPLSPAPTARRDRISSMDVLRGVALMGILIGNILAFGLPYLNFTVQLGTHLPAFSGPDAGINTAFWFARWLLMEGKMRGLFSLLFGAGVILLTSRLEANRADAADIYMRRNLWLLLFGILHAYLIWFGDILYLYGLTALVFLYPCRRLRVRTLLVAGVCVLSMNTLLGELSGYPALREVWLHRQVVVADAAQHAGRALDPAQEAAEQAWAKDQAAWRPDAKTVADTDAAWRGGYLKNREAEWPLVIGFERDLYYGLGFCDILGPMLIGMALLKNGFLTGMLPTRTYALTALIGGATSLAVVGAGTWQAWRSGFDMLTTMTWLLIPFDLGRISGMLAIAAIVLLVVKAKRPGWIMRRIEAVGQTALSNYLLTSLLCQFVFVWGPYKLYDRLEYYQLYGVVAAVWLINMAWSAPWLERFEFGPAEWAWRSLTYWRPQPMRRNLSGSV